MSPWSPPDADEIVVALTIPGDPKSKERPRFGRNGSVYTPRTTVDAEEAVGWAVRAALRGRGVDAEARFGVRLRAFTSSWKARDLDNILKLVLDACTKIVWADDKQVIEMMARLEQADPRPRLEIMIYEISVTRRAPRARSAAKTSRVPAAARGGGRVR